MRTVRHDSEVFADVSQNDNEYQKPMKIGKRYSFLDKSPEEIITTLLKFDQEGLYLRSVQVTEAIYNHTKKGYIQGLKNHGRIKYVNIGGKNFVRPLDVLNIIAYGKLGQWKNMDFDVKNYLSEIQSEVFIESEELHRTLDRVETRILNKALEAMRKERNLSDYYTFRDAAIEIGYEKGDTSYLYQMAKERRLEFETLIDGTAVIHKDIVRKYKKRQEELGKEKLVTKGFLKTEFKKEREKLSSVLKSVEDLTSETREILRGGFHSELRDILEDMVFSISYRGMKEAAKEIGYKDGNPVALYQMKSRGRLRHIIGRDGQILIPLEEVYRLKVKYESRTRDEKTKIPAGNFVKRDYLEKQLKILNKKLNSLFGETRDGILNEVEKRLKEYEAIGHLKYIEEGVGNLKDTKEVVHELKEYFESLLSVSAENFVSKEALESFKEEIKDFMEDANIKKDYCTIKEAAIALGYNSPFKVRLMVRSGEIGYVKKGNCKLIPKEEIQRIKIEREIEGLEIDKNVVTKNYLKKQLDRQKNILKNQLRKTKNAIRKDYRDKMNSMVPGGSPLQKNAGMGKQIERMKAQIYTLGDGFNSKKYKNLIRRLEYLEKLVLDRKGSERDIDLEMFENQRYMELVFKNLGNISKEFSIHALKKGHGKYQGKFLDIGKDKCHWIRRSIGYMTHTLEPQTTESIEDSVFYMLGENPCELEYRLLEGFRNVLEFCDLHNVKSKNEVVSLFSNIKILKEDGFEVYNLLSPFIDINPKCRGEEAFRIRSGIKKLEERLMDILGNSDENKLRLRKRRRIVHDNE